MREWFTESVLVLLGVRDATLQVAQTLTVLLDMRTVAQLLLAALAILFAALVGAADPKPVDLTDLKDAVKAATKKGANVYEVEKALDALEKRLAKGWTAPKPKDPPPAELTALREAVKTAARKGESMDAIRREVEAIEKALLSRIVGDTPAAVIIVANYTSSEVVLSVAEPGEKARSHTIRAHHVQPVTLSGPANLASPLGKWQKIRVDPYRAYVFLADDAGRVRVEGIELPGRSRDEGVEDEKKAQRRDPVKRDPVKIPVTLLVDDADPRTTARWQADVRKRFEAAAEILEAQSGFHLDVAGFDTWKSDLKAKTTKDQLAAFEAAVRVKSGGLAVGFISRRLDQGKDAPFGACRGLRATHVLVREWAPNYEGERVEILVRYLAEAFGAVGSSDTGSVMRPQLGDGQVLHTGFVVRLDPLNALALNLWADQRRAGMIDPADVPRVDGARLLRVYRALAAALPGDARAAEYVKELEKARRKSDDAVGDPP